MGKRAHNLIAGRAATAAFRLGHCAMKRIIIKKVTALLIITPCNAGHSWRAHSHGRGRSEDILSSCWQHHIWGNTERSTGKTQTSNIPAHPTAQQYPPGKPHPSTDSTAAHPLASTCVQGQCEPHFVKCERSGLSQAQNTSQESWFPFFVLLTKYPSLPINCMTK